SQPPWHQMLQTLTEIAAQLQTTEGVRFIRSFAAQRLWLSDRQLDKELPLVIQPTGGAAARADSVFHRNGLIHLQVELINATVRLTEYFGSHFSQETPSIHDLASCSVPFDPSGQGAADAVQQLFKAAAIAQDLQTENEAKKRESPFLRYYVGVSRSLEIQRIHEKLVTLIATILGDHHQRYVAEFARHRLGEELPIPTDVAAGRVSDFGRLRLDAVQWMSELVWYTLRYWIPCYPTTAELAFELSLRVANAPARRAELAQAAQALENEHSTTKGKNSSSLATEMATVIKYCENYQREVPESVAGTLAFYYSIAAALQYQYDLYKERCQADDEQADGDGEEFGGPPTVPLVFSTNFDNALERVFEAYDIGYHVVYPTSRKGGIPVWRLRTCYPESANKTPIDIKWNDVWVDVPKPPTAPPKAGQLIGPLILKIHGAPCLKEAEAGYGHWLVLSEAGYLDALATASNMPDWIKKQLGEQTMSRRSLWFLGYSMSDWNVRLRLFEHCKTGNKGFRGAVDREADIYRTALLVNENLHVEQWVADLSHLPQRLLKLFRIERLPVSEKVLNLVEKVQELLEEKVDGRGSSES